MIQVTNLVVTDATLSSHDLLQLTRPEATARCQVFPFRQHSPLSGSACRVNHKANLRTTRYTGKSEQDLSPRQLSPQVLSSHWPGDAHQGPSAPPTMVQLLLTDLQ